MAFLQFETGVAHQACAGLLSVRNREGNSNRTPHARLSLANVSLSCYEATPKGS
jgi:hypothetical protein